MVDINSESDEIKKKEFDDEIKHTYSDSMSIPNILYE